MYKHPKLQPGCTYAAQHDGILFQSHDVSFSIDLGCDVSPIAVVDALDRMDGSRNIEALLREQGELPAESLHELLQLLDEQYCLTEGWSPTLGGMSGLAFLNELEAKYYNVWLMEQPETELSAMMHEGRTPRDVIVGSVFEYYHVTLRAQDCIAPALARAHGANQKRLLKYFGEEYRHDKLLARSLYALGFSEVDVAESVPLPYTAAMMNLLQRWAKTDLLSFMAGLFVFEDTQAGGDDYIASLERHDLPAEFLEGLRAHNSINASEGHGNISRELYENIEYVSPAAQRRVTASMRVLSDTYLALQDQMLAYYLSPRIGIPRRTAGNVRALQAALG